MIVGYFTDNLPYTQICEHDFSRVWTYRSHTLPLIVLPDRKSFSHMVVTSPSIIP